MPSFRWLIFDSSWNTNTKSNTHGVDFEVAELQEGEGLRNIVVDAEC